MIPTSAVKTLHTTNLAQECRQTLQRQRYIRSTVSAVFAFAALPLAQAGSLSKSASDNPLSDALIQNRLNHQSIHFAAIQRRPVQSGSTVIYSPYYDAHTSLPSMGAESISGAQEISADNLIEVLEKRFNSPVLMLLNGKYEGGVDSFSKGVSYKAKWSKKGFHFELKYQF